MPRTPRVTTANYVYHVLNRAAKRGLLFVQPADYSAFEDLLKEARERIPIRILAYCLMPNHWHLLLWPFGDGDLSRFIKWLSTTHAVRWNRTYESIGNGAVYQSRFKSIPVEPGFHLYWAWRYVERNALRANLVKRAQDWPWGSLGRRTLGPRPEWLDDGPVKLPSDWNDLVNLPPNKRGTQGVPSTIESRPSVWTQRLADQVDNAERPTMLTKSEKIGSDPFYLISHCQRLSRVLQAFGLNDHSLGGTLFNMSGEEGFERKRLGDIEDSR